MADLTNLGHVRDPSLTVKLRLHDITGCQPGWTTGGIVLTNIQPIAQPVW